ncbi:MAG: radical SAM protein, partial [Methanosarcinales archaeon]
MENKDKSKYLISVWLTDGCNLKCKYCFQDHYKPVVHMSDKIVEQTIKFINSFENIEGVAFFGGEPTLRKKQLKRMLAGTNSPRYFLTTNGTMLDDEILDWFAAHRVHINLSLDGMKDTQDFWRDGSYDRIMENLPRLLEHQKKYGLQVLCLGVMESKLYRNVKHIKDLGFNSVYINLLDPYSDKVRNEPEKVEIFKEQYKRVVTELHDPETFHVSDFQKWQKLLTEKSGH